MKLLLTIVTLFLAVPAASAKEFQPGDLRLCGATRCQVIEDRAVLRSFTTFFWLGHHRARVRRPAVGSPVYQLRFRSGMVGAVVSGNAIRVHGLNCELFRRGLWYRLPPGLRGLAAGHEPRRLTTAVPRSC